jgi:orotidine-5'-phosphate decarboxylase
VTAERGRKQAAAERVCIALDFAGRGEILDAARRFGPRVGWLKIGLEAFVGHGPAVVGEVAGHARVFLDLKLHDTPNTVARAAAAAARSGASMINVHASGGRAMLRAAREALPPDGPILVAVTLLTSLDPAALADLPMAGHPEGIVRRLAALARECGLDGVVCSPAEIASVRAECGPEFRTVVPGIRPAGAETGDQKRLATPSHAVAAGADLLVIGRPITAAADPDAALEAILEEIESGLELRSKV